MFEEAPTPDDDVPEDVVDRLENESPETLRAVAGYAIALADAREVENGPGEANGDDALGDVAVRQNDSGATADLQDTECAGADDGGHAEVDDGEPVVVDDGEPVEIEDGDRPDGVPGKASITVKEINENRYYYWQWRDGDAVKSTYHGPVDSGS